MLSEGEDPNELDESGKAPLDYAIDDNIMDLLFICGAIRDPDYYLDMRFAGNYEMAFRFDDEFRYEVFLKLKEQYPEALDNADERSIEAADEGALNDLKLIGIKSVEAGVPHHSDEYIDQFALHDLFERCGYSVCYEGNNNAL